MLLRASPSTITVVCGVIALISDGLSNKEIGKRLQVATYTVKSHVHNIMEKLSLRSRVEVAVRAGIRA